MLCKWKFSKVFITYYVIKIDQWLQRRVFVYRLYISHQTVHYNHLEETTYNINIAPFFFSPLDQKDEGNCHLAGKLILNLEFVMVDNML